MHGVHIWDNSHILKVSQFHTSISTLNYQNTPKSLKTLFKSIPCNLLSNSKRLTTDRLLESLARQNSFQADRNQWGHTSISNCHNSQPTTQPQAGEENRYPQLDHMVMSTKISRWLCQWEWHKNWGKKKSSIYWYNLPDAMALQEKQSYEHNTKDTVHMHTADTRTQYSGAVTEMIKMQYWKYRECSIRSWEEKFHSVFFM